MSWASTFARFHTGRVPLLGPVVLRVADWSKPQPGHAPMFDYPPLLERLSVVHPTFPTAVDRRFGVTSPLWDVVFRTR